MVRNYYENLIPTTSPTDHMELREGSNEDEDLEEHEEVEEEDQVGGNYAPKTK